jgi:hypothetical protein
MKRLSVVASVLAILFCRNLSAVPQLGAPFLLIWPTARSTALAGAMTGLADDADAAYWNPGGVGLQKSLSLEFSTGRWLPGLYPGMHYTFSSASYCIADALGKGTGLGLGVNATYAEFGDVEIIDEHGYYLGRFTAWRGAFGLHGGVGLLGNRLGVGTAVKLVYLKHKPLWAWEVMPELGIDCSGTGSSVAADLGVLYRPIKPLSAGLTVANLGPEMTYDGDRPDPLPSLLRLGLCWTPLDMDLVRLRVLGEADKVLVGMFWDTTGTKTFGQKLQWEFRSAWKSLGAEVMLLRVVELRIGYFEDLAGARGGFVVERDDGEMREHVGLGDILTRKGLGRVTKVGICWGVGIGYKDYVRLDVSSDAAIYNFSTNNLKLAFAANDIFGLVEEAEKLFAELQ